jgi:hypothetical protein
MFLQPQGYGLHTEEPESGQPCSAPTLQHHYNTITANNNENIVNTKGNGEIEIVVLVAAATC